MTLAIFDLDNTLLAGDSDDLAHGIPRPCEGWIGTMLFGWQVRNYERITGLVNDVLERAVAEVFACAVWRNWMECFTWNTPAPRTLWVSPGGCS